MTNKEPGICGVCDATLNEEGHCPICNDPVNHPTHYKSHPSGIECIQITAHMNFCLGNAMKYLWRAGHKGKTVEDLRKAIWYIMHEIERIQK